jgi:hypothetical protein
LISFIIGGQQSVRDLANEPAKTGPRYQFISVSQHCGKANFSFAADPKNICFISFSATLKESAGVSISRSTQVP